MELNRFAAMNMVYNKFSFGYFLDSMERLGIGKFEFWTGVPHLFPFISSMGDPGKIRKEIGRRGLSIVCVTPEQVLYPYNIASSNNELRHLSLDYFYKNIEICGNVGADKLLCCSGWGDFDGDRETAFARAIDGLGLMEKRAKELGVTLAFEVLSTFETNLACDLTSTKRILDAIPSKNLMLCVDTVAVNMGGNTLDEYLNTFKGRICHFHLTDGSPSGHVPLGLGTLPVKDYIRMLDDAGYTGNITLEIGDTSWADRPEEATRTAFENLKFLLRKRN
jgi:protein FrlC